MPLEERHRLTEECDAIPYYDVEHGRFGSIPHTLYKLHGSIGSLAFTMNQRYLKLWGRVSNLLWHPAHVVAVSLPSVRASLQSILSTSYLQDTYFALWKTESAVVRLIERRMFNMLSGVQSRFMAYAPPELAIIRTLAHSDIVTAQQNARGFRLPHYA